jgi:hypothetical protein
VASLDELRARWSNEWVFENPGLDSLGAASFCLIVEGIDYRSGSFYTFCAVEDSRSALASLRYGLIPDVLCEGGEGEREEAQEDIVGVFAAHSWEPGIEDIATFREYVSRIDTALADGEDACRSLLPAVVEAFNRGVFTVTSRFDWQIVAWGDFPMVWGSDLVQGWIEDSDDQLEHLIKKREFDPKNPAHLELAKSFLRGFLHSQS